MHLAATSWPKLWPPTLVFGTAMGRCCAELWFSHFQNTILEKFRLKVAKFKQSTKAAVVGPALDRCKRRYWPNNNSRLLAAEIGPILCSIISFGNSHLAAYSSERSLKDEKYFFRKRNDWFMLQ